LFWQAIFFVKKNISPKQESNGASCPYSKSASKQREGISHTHPFLLSPGYPTNSERLCQQKWTALCRQQLRRRKKAANQQKGKWTGVSQAENVQLGLSDSCVGGRGAKNTSVESTPNAINITGMALISPAALSKGRKSIQGNSKRSQRKHSRARHRKKRTTGIVNGLMTKINLGGSFLV